MARRTLTISLQREDAIRIDIYWRKKGYKDRSQFISEAIEEKIQNDKKKKDADRKRI